MNIMCDDDDDDDDKRIADKSCTNNTASCRYRRSFPDSMLHSRRFSKRDGRPSGRR